MAAADKVAAALAKYGRPMTLSCLASTGRAAASVVVNGVAQGFRPEEMTGDVIRGDQRIQISNAEIAAASWPGPPRKGDKIVVDGRAWVLRADAETKYLGTEALAHVLHVRGG
ncbi:MAG: hypothetical protein ING19_20825 [Azospirillum sp.]|nr:hypothetical protein [Azospirillum sp.]MCA3268496.1 hypothetical protein [Azospirillum sp.]